ncbi:hypothetical protein GF352_04850 [archaeon]|nr:hypothetical protein [archaeon]
MRTRLVFIGVIIFLAVVIVFLSISLLKPEERPRRVTFNDVIQLVNEKREAVKSIKIIYGVNASLASDDFTGEVVYSRFDDYTSFNVDPVLDELTGTALLINPDDLVNFIVVNDRAEYSGLLEELRRPCWSTITEPNSSAYERVIDGDYIFVTCFDRVTGYPLTVYAGEVAGEDVVFTKLFAKNITYELL